MPRSPMRVWIFVPVICFLTSGLLWATSFPKVPQFRTGTSDFAAMGDFNGDGKLDGLGISQCMPAPCSTFTIGVSLGNGRGQFTPPILSTTGDIGSQGESVVVGDFNNDHKLDIALVSMPPIPTTLGSVIAIVLGNGDGTFGSTMVLQIPALVISIFAGDVNGDGNLDLVAFASGLQVFLGNGDGTFRALPLGPGAYGECVLADVNHDGKLDMVGLSVQLGNGDGTFGQPQQVISGGQCPAVADFNGDGNLDIAEQSHNGQSPSYYNQNGLNLHFGNGDGTFQPPVFMWIGSAGQSGFAAVSAGDFNGDGKLDLMVLRGREIDILLNKGNAKFRPAVGYLEVGWPLLADINGDGRTDLIFDAGSPPDYGVVIPVLAGTDGTFSLPRSFILADGIYADSIQSADLNNDGILDLVEVSQESGDWRAGHLNRLLGNGDGTFKMLPSILSGGKDSYALALSDLNGDGNIDTLVASGDSINVGLGLGDGNFQQPLNYPLGGAWLVIATADFNGDGIPDLAQNTSSLGTGMILFGNGDGTFRAGNSLGAQFDSVVAGDFNGDGKQDLGVAKRGFVGVMLGNGDGTFQPISVLRKGYTRYLLAGDFNSDGKLDLAAVGTTPAGSAIASMYLGNGDGTLQASLNTGIAAASDPGGLAAADFNGDGKLDLAVSLSSNQFAPISNQVAVLAGDGTGRFQSPKLYPGGSGPLVAGDFDRNGTQDLAVITSDKTVAILLNK